MDVWSPLDDIPIRQGADTSSVAILADKTWTGPMAAWGAVASGCFSDVVLVGRTAPVCDALLQQVGSIAPAAACRFRVRPSDIESASELALATGGPIDALVACAGRSGTRLLARSYAMEHSRAFVAAHATEHGASIASLGDSVSLLRGRRSAVWSMAAGGAAIEHVRDHVLGTAAPWLGPTQLRHRLARPRRPSTIVQVGVGGIGTHAAWLIARDGHRLVLVDDDVVERVNIGRQALFEPGDAAGAVRKVDAYARALRAVVPRARVTPVCHRVGAGSHHVIRGLSPSLLVSAVDNARTRLVLEKLARRLGVPIVQGGIGAQGASVYTMLPDEVGLDEQMHGALRRAAHAESRAPRAHCTTRQALTIPAMICGSMIAARVRDVLAGRVDLAPFHWRSYGLPFDSRVDDVPF